MLQRCASRIVVRCWLAGVAALAAMAAPALAQPTGKCCLPNGRGCRAMTAEICAGNGGLYFPDQTCSSVIEECFETVGACCPSSGAACSVTSQSLCNGTWFQEGSCSPDPCSPATGACCLGETCEVRTQAACSGEWVLGLPCTPEFCVPGVCCLGTGCTPSVAQACEEPGTWFANGVCVPFFCRDPHGACCTEGDGCIVINEFNCEGTFFLGGACEPGLCAPGAGACCTGPSCALVDAGACGSGSFQGVGSTCDFAGNPVTCCRANFDRSGGVQVSDIFAFLSAWFALEGSADFDGNGQVQVGDIFTFLSAWFAGCA